jgi:hypothetical protein
MVSQAIVLLVAAIASAIIFAVVKLLGRGPRFGTIFKASALALTMLPMMVVLVLVIFAIEVVASMLLLLVLHITGVLPNYIPHDYEVFGLWGMLATALALALFPGRELLRYVIHVAREK